jgi:hypothetical protein
VKFGAPGCECVERDGERGAKETVIHKRDKIEWETEKGKTEEPREDAYSD